MKQWHYKDIEQEKKEGDEQMNNESVKLNQIVKSLFEVSSKAMIFKR